ncbi:hypothetical protein GGR92_001891 [Spirosoma lacussanchae]|uniref:hypothetical protein n=1 Tax=Spirosoma lacussanchae TaxID=1884249 RepID=UPI0011086884|nr:hypothetical protein [Spirosoma lacussanchae]
MKRMLILLPGVLLGVLLGTVACKQDKASPAPGSASVAAPAFVGPRWHMTAFRLDPPTDFDGDGKLDTDLLSFMSACDRDNALVFDPGGKLITTDGQITCDTPETGAARGGSWTYNYATRTITITSGSANSVTTWEVADLTSQTLTIHATITEEGKPLRTTIVWKAVP